MLTLMSVITQHMPANGDLLKFRSSMYVKETRNMADMLRNNPNLEQYHYIEFGDLLDDEGLIPNGAETLSHNDDHVLDEDLIYFHRIATSAKYATFVVYDRGILTVLYFVNKELTQ